jgi:putative chitinase
VRFASIAELQAVMVNLPDDRAAVFEPWLAAAACERAIATSPARLAAFLAQIAHESAELARTVENLNYSAAGLRKTWPSRFPTLALAEVYARKPMAIANKVYADRLGNGPEASGDGWRFRGRGLIQLTGRSNYRAAALALGLPLEGEPELLEQPGPASRSAAWYWQDRGLNELADAGIGEAFANITRRINGGLTGHAERVRYWARAKQALGV